MKNLKKYFVLLLMLMPLVLYGQQEPMYGQYIFNSSVLNPAQAGADNTSHFGVLARNQWVGIDGAPKTETLYGNFRLPKDLGVSVGLYQDRLGPEVNLHFQTDLAYHAQLSRNIYLAGGIRFNVSHLRVNLAELEHVDPRNPYFHENLSSGLQLNAGIGFLAYNQKTFVGLSLPRAFRNRIKITEADVADFRKQEVRHLFLYGGTNLDLAGGEVTFTPSTLIKYGEDSPLQLDLNAVFNFVDVLEAGPLLRSNLTGDNDWFDAVGFMAGIRLFERWYFGYVYEHPLTSLRHATRQTHEISLRFIWDQKYPTRVRSPRYFR